MTNSIFKSFLKKLVRSEAFVSVIIVFVLAIGIIGTSYALYMDVDTDTNYQLVEVGDLSIGFNNGDNTIKLTNMTPTDDDIAVSQSDNLFSFYIYNTGTYTTNYDIKLVTENGNTIGSEYINYQICKDNSNNCKDIKTLGDITDSIIYTDELSPKRTSDSTNPSSYYFLRIWINNKYNIDSSVKENETVVLKVLIEAKNASGYLDNDNTLVGKLLSDDRVKINNTIPSIESIADYVTTGDVTSGELGLFKTDDDYGISYYYRGAQSYNYVDFAGFTWRIVRINGDGSIRLILDGTLDKVIRDGEKNYAGGTSLFNTSYDDNAYIGYMYGTNESETYNDTHDNVNDSVIKDTLDSFYEKYIENDESNYHFEKYLSDSLFCGDKSLANIDQIGYNKNITEYSSYKRLQNPSLKCAEGESNDYSRYTAGILAGIGRFDTYSSTNKGVTINNDLTYPIALLSTDELVFAGAYYGAKNQTYYLSDAYYYTNSLMNDSWWTMSTYNYSGNQANVFSSRASSDSIKYNIVSDNLGVRPVINLKADVLYKEGEGTKEKPYIIKLS